LIASVVGWQTPTVNSIVASVKLAIEEPSYIAIDESSLLDGGEWSEPINVPASEISPVLGRVFDGKLRALDMRKSALWILKPPHHAKDGRQRDKQVQDSKVRMHESGSVNRISVDR